MGIYYYVLLLLNFFAIKIIITVNCLFSFVSDYGKMYLKHLRINRLRLDWFDKLETVTRTKCLNKDNSGIKGFGVG